MLVSEPFNQQVRLFLCRKDWIMSESSGLMQPFTLSIEKRSTIVVRNVKGAYPQVSMNGLIQESFKTAIIYAKNIELMQFDICTQNTCLFMVVRRERKCQSVLPHMRGARRRSAARHARAHLITQRWPWTILFYRFFEVRIAWYYS